MSARRCHWCKGPVRANAEPFGNDTYLLCDSCMEMRLENERVLNPEPGSPEDRWNRLDQADYEDRQLRGESDEDYDDRMFDTYARGDQRRPRESLEDYKNRLRREWPEEYRAIYGEDASSVEYDDEDEDEDEDEDADYDAEDDDEESEESHYSRSDTSDAAWEEFRRRQV